MIALVVTLAVACGSRGDASASPSSPAVLTDANVEAACGQCQFGLEGEGCDLAVRVDDDAWFVDGTSIDDHGDAHAEDGFCNAVRGARVTGQVEGGRFVATSFRLLTPEDDPGD